MLCYESKAITDIGNHREINQDNYVEITNYIDGVYIGIFCVADGMGGLFDGEFASGVAVSKTQGWYEKNLKQLPKLPDKKIKDSLKVLFYDINKEILTYSKEKNQKVGTTYSLLLIVGDKYYVVHAGDSRIYMKREGKLFLLTKDQTWVNEQLELGVISEEQALNHPRKNVLANCLGCFEMPSICIGLGEIYNGDSFLLCSDGLYNLVTSEEISSGMSNGNFEFMASEFIRLVKERGAYDNITLLMIRTINSDDDITTADI